jgi:putative hydrolase of the HAD superfamily
LLIIFDLDDTLIDTSKCITPFQLKRALKEVIEHGFLVDSFDEALNSLLLLDKKCKTAKETLKIFFKGRDVNEKFYLLALKKVYEKLPDECKIFAVPYANATLKLLSSKHTLAIVSSGKHDIQLHKLEKASIDRSFFCKIKITSTKGKKKNFESLIQEFTLEGDKVVVCGDKVDIDLMPAKQIGCITVLMRCGRGLNQPNNRWVDFTISSLPELNKILEEL